MDAVDRKLVDALRVNARATYAELARQVGLSAPAVHERVGKLESSGVITGYHASIAAESLGYAMNALVGIFITDSADTDEIATALAELPAVEHCWFVAGEETYVVKVRVPDVGGLEATIRELHSIPGIARTRTTVVLSTKFEDRVPAPLHSSPAQPSTEGPSAGGPSAGGPTGSAPVGSGQSRTAAST